VPVDFFAVAAQVFPVFLVALAVEQRLVDRLGSSEEQYVRDANHVLRFAINARQAYESLDDEEAKRFEEIARSKRRFRWVDNLVDDMLLPYPDLQPDFDSIARNRYRRRRSREILLVTSVVALLLVGEIAALVGLISHGTSVACGWFLCTFATLVATFAIVTLAAFRDALPGAD